jgi:hypothetical protein
VSTSSPYAPVRHSGSIAPGVVVQFIYDPSTGELASALSGDPRLHPRSDVLRRYRSIRHEFFERVAAVTGSRVAVLEIDEVGNADGLHVIDEPKAGRA